MQLQLTIKDDFLFLSRVNPGGFFKNKLISSIFDGKGWRDSISSFVTIYSAKALFAKDRYKCLKCEVS